MQNSAYIIVRRRDYGVEPNDKQIIGTALTEVDAVMGMYEHFAKEVRAFKNHIDMSSIKNKGHFDVCKYPDCTDKTCAICYTNNSGCEPFDYSTRVWVEEHPIIRI